MPSEKTLRAAQNFLIAHIVTIRRRLDLATYRNHVISEGDEVAAWERHHRDKEYRALSEGLDWAAEEEEARRCTDRCRDLGIEVLLLSDPRYPEMLKSIYDPPPMLFVRGAAVATLFSRPMVAIVGSRRGDPRSCDFAGRLARELVENGNVVVSGLALGIDGAAHAGALDGGVEGTVAVFGSGVDAVYPRVHEALARRILDRRGALLSAYVPGTPAFPAHFLERNRIVTGLSSATVIVQAMARSGALNSARYALEQGREVLAVPGPVRDSRYEGSNRLLKEGAAVVTDPSDLWEYIPGLARKNKLEAEPQQHTAHPCVEYLRANGAVPYDQLLRRFPEDLELAGAVLELELLGIVRREPGNIVRLA